MCQAYLILVKKQRDVRSDQKGQGTSKIKRGCLRHGTQCKLLRKKNMNKRAEDDTSSRERLSMQQTGAGEWAFLEDQLPGTACHCKAGGCVELEVREGPLQE